MFHLVKLVFLLSILSGTANAQWGAVVSQPDTNRFINSQQDFGLIMPHQQVVVGLLDTTVSSVGIQGGNASKVIVGSLLDHEDNCANYSIVNGVASCAGSYEKWREMEKSTSWYQAARGDTTAMFPTNYAVTITTGQDSVVIWNRDTAELWMGFILVAENMIYSVSPFIATDLDMLDGILYVSKGTANGVTMIDFLKDEGHLFDASGHYLYPGNIQERNDVNGITLYSSTPAIANSVVNAVAVGLKDALGRPKHWWVVSTGTSNTGSSIFNPRLNAIFDRAATSLDPLSGHGIDVSKQGQIIEVANNSGFEDVAMAMNVNIFAVMADGYSQAVNYGAASSGNPQLGWPSSTIGMQAWLTDDHLSIVGENASRFLISSTQGLYVIHPKGAWANGATQNEGGAKQRFSATVNAPVEFGNNVVALAMEDLTVDSSPYANTIVAGGSPGNPYAVFGKGYSSAVGSSLSCENQAEFAVPSGDPWAASVWMKKESVSSTDQQIVHLTNTAVTQFIQIYLRGGTCKPYFHVLNGTGDFVEGGASVCDGEWHHLAVYESGGVLRAFVDGVSVGTDASLAHGVLTGIDDLYVGSASPMPTLPRNHYDGLLDDLTISIGTVLTEDIVAKIHAEGRKKLAMGTPVFANTTDDALLSNNVVDIDALDNGMWAVAFSDANTVQVFDGRIPIQQIAAPAGTVKSIALIQSPGTDSVGVAIGTTTNLKFVQPSINLRAAMAHRYQEPIHVGTPVIVDSSGVGGIFWTGNDGIKAASNAKRTEVYVLDGTYGPIVFNSGAVDFSCSAPKAALPSPGVVFNGNGTAKAMETQAGSGVVHVDRCAFYTAPGGAGGGFGAVEDNGDGNLWMTNNIIIDSDYNGITLGAPQSRFEGNRITGADLHCFEAGPSGDLARINGNFCSGEASTSITIHADAENPICVGNNLDSTISDASGTGNCSTTHNNNF